MAKSCSKAHRLHVVAAAAIAAIGIGSAHAASVSWVGPNLSFWDLASNWSPGLPGALDDVLLGAFDTEFRIGNVTIQSFTGTGLLRITGGILQTTQASSIGSLFMSAGVLGGTGDLTISGSSTWTGGTMTGVASTTFQSGLSITGANGKGISNGRSVNAGDTTWSGNTGSNNNAITLAGGGVFNNTGTFTDANTFDSNIVAGGGSGNAFNNAGIFNKQANTTTAVNVAFNNIGTLNVNAGTFLPGGGGTSSGTFNIANGAKLELRNGSHTLNNVTIGGAGTFQVSTDNVGADALVTLNGGTLGTAFVMSGSTLTGSNQLFQGPATWSGGTIAGAASTTFGSTLAITGATSKLLSAGRTVNAGNTTWSGNTGNNNNAITLAGASVFNNTGTFTDANTFNSSISAGGGGGTFNNAGIFNKQANTTTDVGVAFSNTGTLNVNAGTFLGQGGGTSSGTFNIANGAKLELRNGNYTLNNVTISGPGTFQVSTDNVGADAIVTLNGGALGTAFVLSGSTLTGTDQVFPGLATWSGGTISGAASTTFNNNLTISGPNPKTVLGGRVVNLNGTTTWTGNSANNNNAIQFWNGGTINNNATFNDVNTFNSFIEHVTGGPHNFNNVGTYNKQSNTITLVDAGVAFNNTGTVNLNAGTFHPSGGGTSTGVFNIAAGATLDFVDGNSTLNNVTTSGTGTFMISTNSVGADAVVSVNGGTHTTPFVLSGSTLAGTDHTFQGLATWSGGTISGAASTTFNNDLTISGPNPKTVFGGRVVNLNGTTTWTGNTAINNNAIQFWNGGTINNNATFNDVNAFDSFIEHVVGGPHNFNNVGTYNKQSNTITTVDLGVVFNNSGTLNINAGTMRFFSGTLGPTGTVKVAAGATFQHDAASTVGNLITAGTLALSTKNVTVFADYDNANFGVGNAFAPRANVTGTGFINAAGTPSSAQVLTGAGLPPGSILSSGTTATPTLTIGNVHVGSNSVGYQIANNNLGGPAIRGAIQTTVGGANITDPRLSGSGVTAGNFGPIAAGASSNFGVTFTADSAGVLAPLTGQVVRIANNFDNVAEQNLSIVLGAGAAAYNLAAGSVAPNPLNLGNQRVNGSAVGALTVANVAPAGSFSERLDASFGTLTGAVVSNSGSISQLAAGTSNGSAMTLGLNGSTAGAKSGTAQVLLASNGNGTSGLGITALAPQTITVNGNFFQPAAGQLNTAALNFGTVQVGQSVSRVLSITNSATGPAGFVEDLNARFGASSGQGAAQILGSGSISGLAAGGTNASAMTVNVNTNAAGSINGAIGINFFSAGAVNGVTNGLGELAVGSLDYGVLGTIQSQGQVIDQAVPVINNAPINLGNVRVGAASPTQFVSVTNQATGNSQAALNASINAAAPLTASGSFSLLAPGGTNNNSLLIGMDTSSAGSRNGTAVLTFVSDASNVGNCAPNCQMNLAPQNVAVTGGVYRLANPTLDTPAVDMAARVGDVAPTRAIGITNSSPDSFTERLNASIGAGPAGFTTAGSVTGLAAGASSSALGVSLNTGSAGAFAGQAAVSFVSSGVGTTGAPDANLGSRNVNLTGRVYAPAVAQLNSAGIEFGIVHKGDVVTPRNISVSNAAANAALNDTLAATSGGGGGAFNVAGSVNGLAAGATDTSRINVTLNTQNAGVFSGNAVVSFASHNPDMADASLGTRPVSLAAQVNNYAEVALAKASGAGSFSHATNSYTLDFGTLVQGVGPAGSVLQLSNAAIGPADLLRGSFDLSSFDPAHNFSLTGFGSFASLAAGDVLSGLGVSFAANLLGSFDELIVLHSAGSNASGYDVALGDVQLHLLGSVASANPVPEPETWLLMVSGLAMLVTIARRRGCRARMTNAG